MKKIVLISAALLVAVPAFAVDSPKTEDQKTFYSVGVSVSKSLSVFNLSSEELEYVKLGLIEAQSGKKPDFDVSTYTPKIQEMARNRRKILGEKQVILGKAFLEKASTEKGAQKLPNGMVYRSIVEGKGDHPKATDVVKVNYRGTLPDGKEFDSSYKRGRPLEFKLDNVIKCWTEGVQKMKPGGKAYMVCPSNLAYGEAGAGNSILPGATLAFEVELIDFKKIDNSKPVDTKAAPVNVKK